MAENPTDETPSTGPIGAAETRGDVQEAKKKPRKKTSATRFFLRGLAISLPPILTIVILLWLGQGVYDYIIRPINWGVQSTIAIIVDDSKRLDDADLEALPDPPGLPLCGTDYLVLQSENRKKLPPLEPNWHEGIPPLRRVFVIVGKTDHAIPYESYALVVENTAADEMPTTIRGMYMIVATHQHFQGQFLLSTFGFLLAIIVLYFLGRLVTIRIGAWGVRKFESVFVGRLPLVSNVYASVKRVTDFLFSERTIEYNRIVAIEYPRRGIWSLGFVTGESMLEMTATVGEPLVTVLIPTSPMPVTGYTVNLPKSEILDLNVTIDQAFQFCISCGVLVPEHQQVTPQKLQEELARRLTAGSSESAVTRPPVSVDEPATDLSAEVRAETENHSGLPAENRADDGEPA